MYTPLYHIYIYIYNDSFRISSLKNNCHNFVLLNYFQTVNRPYFYSNKGQLFFCQTGSCDIAWLVTLTSAHSTILATVYALKMNTLILTPSQNHI